MKRRTQELLYRLLPALFWLLAIGGSLVPISPFFTFHFSLFSYLSGYIVAALCLIVIVLIGRIKRHSSSIEECFQMALLLGVASYWLPTVVFLTIPVWGYLIYQNLFSWRSFMATLIGYITITIWAAGFVFLGWINNPWIAPFAPENTIGWIPVGAILVAWLASTIARQSLRTR